MTLPKMSHVAVVLPGAGRQHSCNQLKEERRIILAYGSSADMAGTSYRKAWWAAEGRRWFRSPQREEQKEEQQGWSNKSQDLSPVVSLPPARLHLLKIRQLSHLRMQTHEPVGDNTSELRRITNITNVGQDKTWSHTPACYSQKSQPLPCLGTLPSWAFRPCTLVPCNLRFFFFLLQ